MRPTRRRLGLALLAALAVTAGCGGDKEPDLAHGRELFLNGTGGRQACAYCHGLRAAGSVPSFGPDLDEDIAGDRAQGIDEAAIDEEVRGLLRNGNCPEPSDPTRCMPPKLVTGGDAVDVAAFVARCAASRASGCRAAPPGNTT